MPLILIIVLLTALKYFAVGPFADLSWWWVAGALALAFVWFEFIEPQLGLSKDRQHDAFDKLRQERIKRTFEIKKRPDRQ